MYSRGRIFLTHSLHEECVKNIRFLNISDASYIITGFLTNIYVAVAVETLFN